MTSIGILSMQGAVAEHLTLLSRIDNIFVREVKTINDLEKISGIILPGGESTAIGKLLKDYGLIEPLADRINGGMPVWGTCAGMILMAKKIINQSDVYLGVMDIEVKRNAYGSQLNSFSTKLCIPDISAQAIPAVFIRAPVVEKVGNNVEVLASLNNSIVAVRQNNMLATSFHPELTEDLTLHRYFIGMMQQYCKT